MALELIYKVTEGYTTLPGDTVDYIAWRVYGTNSGRITERLLEANPGLADLGVELPGGILVKTPTMDKATVETGTRLWS